jgi:hypothetical protein
MIGFLKRRRKRTLIIGAVVLALAIAGTAAAIWNMTESTTVLKGSTGSTITLTITAPTAGDLAAATQCYPGGSCPLVGEVSNPSGTAISLVSYQPSVANGFDGGVGCPAGGSSGINGPAQGTASVAISPAITVPAGATNQVIDLPNALSLGLTATSSCQGKTISETSGSILLSYTAGA